MNEQKLREYLKKRITQLEKDKTLTSYTRVAKIAENRRLLRELGEATDVYSDSIRNK